MNILKSAEPRRVGDISLIVKKVDTKRNRYTVEVLAADQRIEKKDKSLNEPVQFYITGAASQPYELVVNEVKKDRIIGYLASPKIKLARLRRKPSPHGSGSRADSTRRRSSFC